MSLSDKPGVSEATRENVKEVARRLGYVRNAAGATLRTGADPTIGIYFDLSADDAGPVLGAPKTGRPLLFPLRLSNQLLATLTAAGLRAHLITPGTSIGAVDALVYIGGRAEGTLHHATGSAAPVIVCGAVPDDLVPQIRVELDHRGMTNQVLNHLSKNGYSSPALILHDGDGDQYTAVASTYQEWCEVHGVAQHLSRVKPGGPPASDVARTVIDSGADSIYDLSGRIADVLHGIENLGLSVPRDIGLVSRSEGDVAASMTPSVTSMSMLGQQVGQIIGEATIRTVGRSLDVRERIVCPFELTVRESTTRTA
jgi:LacI family transcriptional regulator